MGKGGRLGGKKAVVVGSPRGIGHLHLSRTPSFVASSGPVVLQVHRNGKFKGPLWATGKEVGKGKEACCDVPARLLVFVRRVSFNLACALMRASFTSGTATKRGGVRR